VCTGQDERLAKLIAKTGGGAIKRKKTTEEVDKRPMPARASHEHRIHELLRNMFGDRTFLDDVIREAGSSISFHLSPFWAASRSESAALTRSSATADGRAVSVKISCQQEKQVVHQIHNKSQQWS